MSSPLQITVRQIQKARRRGRGTPLRDVPLVDRQEGQRPFRRIEQSIGSIGRLVRRRTFRRIIDVRRMPQGQKRHIGRRRQRQGRRHRRLHPHRRGRGSTPIPSPPRPGGLLQRHLRQRASELGLHVPPRPVGVRHGTPGGVQSIPLQRGKIGLRGAGIARDAPEIEGGVDGPDAELRGVRFRRVPERDERHNGPAVRHERRSVAGTPPGHAVHRRGAEGPGRGEQARRSRAGARRRDRSGRRGIFGSVGRFRRRRRRRKFRRGGRGGLVDGGRNRSVRISEKVPEEQTRHGQESVLGGASALLPQSVRRGQGRSGHRYRPHRRRRRIRRGDRIAIHRRSPGEGCGQAGGIRRKGERRRRRGDLGKVYQRSQGGIATDAVDVVSASATAEGGRGSRIFETQVRGDIRFRRRQFQH
mmetsp:Transcript_4738/g.13369  ORF Transcript_4738/g.13369 Transcript_4738/m.13369 type:complete len:415 (-) Transcript_4738:4067-5311(-)